MHCADCERIPRAVHPESRLLLAFPPGRASAAFAAALGRAGLPADRAAPPFGLAVACFPAELARLAEAAAEALTAEEQAATRCLLLPAGREPGPADLLGARSLGQVIGAARGAWLAGLIEEDRLFCVLQPILRADRSPYGEEALLRGRGRDGAVIGAGRLFDAARQGGLLFALELKARRLALEAKAAHGRRGTRLFVNFDPAAVCDPARCLGRAHDLVRDLGLSPSDVVFEVTEGGKVRDLGHLRRVLDLYRRAGFGVALDDLGAGYSGLTLLRELRPDYVKPDREMIRGVQTDPLRQTVLRHVVALSHEMGALCLAEGIEAEAEFAWAAAEGVDLFQGFLLGVPTAAADAAATGAARRPRPAVPA